MGDDFYVDSPVRFRCINSNTSGLWIRRPHFLKHDKIQRIRVHWFSREPKNSNIHFHNIVWQWWNCDLINSHYRHKQYRGRHHRPLVVRNVLHKRDCFWWKCRRDAYLLCWKYYFTEIACDGEFIIYPCHNSRPFIRGREPCLNKRKFQQFYLLVQQ